MRQEISPVMYQAKMRKEGIKVVFNKSRTTGHISGMSYKIGDVTIKASDVDRSLGFNKLFKAFYTTKSVNSAISATKTHPFSSPLFNSLLTATAGGTGDADLAKDEEDECKKRTVKR